MNEEHLHKLLEQLQGESRKSAESDPEASVQLTAALEDVRAGLRDRPGASHDATLLESLRSAALRFEANHPKIVETVEELIETLTRLGI